MLESGGAGAVSSGGRPAVVAAGVSRHPDGDSAWQLRGARVNVSSGLPDVDDSPGCRVGGLRLRRQAHSKLVDFVSESSSSSHHVDHVCWLRAW